MAFGFSYESNAGEIVPIVKYNAQAGRLFRIDRVEGQNEQVDITQSFKAVMDFENVEVGFINFPIGAAPQFCMVPLGSPMPAKPSEDHRQGIRMMMKLGKECGGDIREIATNAKTVLRSFEDCHNAYEAGCKANPGKLPVVVLKTTIPIKSQGSKQGGTNYAPVFEITGWVNRPDDLVFVPKGGGATSAPAPAPTTPPSTGSTPVAAPAAADDDFG